MSADAVSFVTVYVGLGANLGNPSEQVRLGMAALAALAPARGLRCSALYRSAPVGPVPDQPDFVNAVCALQTSLTAEALMRALLEIEARHGRVRGAAKGGPRSLDLDLLLYGQEVIRSPRLTVPHPRLHERAFVLAPLTELDPELTIPGRGRVADLLAACVGQRVERLKT